MKSLRRFILRVRPMLPVWGLAAIGLVLGLIVMGAGAFLFHRARVDALAQAQSADAVNRLRSAMDDQYRRRLQMAVRWLSLGASDLEEEAEPIREAAGEASDGADIAVGSTQVREPYERLRAALEDLSLSAEASRAWGQQWRERQARLSASREACDVLIQDLRSRIATHGRELAQALASARLGEDHAGADRLSKTARRLAEMDGAIAEAIVQVGRLIQASSEDRVADIAAHDLAEAFRALSAFENKGDHGSDQEEPMASAIQSLRRTVLGTGEPGEDSLAGLLGECLAAQLRRSDLRRELLGRVDACDSARAALEAVLSGAPWEIQAAASATQRRALLITLAATGACGLGFLFASRAVALRLHKQLESLRSINADLHNSQLQLLQAQKLESIGQLAAGIAHEINTPAQYVSDNVRFLRDQFDPVMKVIDKYSASLDQSQAARSWAERCEEVKKVMDELDYEFVRREIPGAIEQSLEGLERISTIVRAMKDFSHPGSDVKQPADLNHAIESTVTVCKTRWKYVADLQLELDPNLPPVPCLLGEMNQVFLNLIVNAADAIGSKHGETHKGLIVVRTSMDGDCVEVAIEDNGGGIPESVQDRIFDPFFTTKGVGKGTGQGLAISRNVVVNKHRGVLEFWSTPGTGTTFVIRLPLREQAAPPLKAAA